MTTPNPLRRPRFPRQPRPVHPLPVDNPPAAQEQRQEDAPQPDGEPEPGPAARSLDQPTAGEAAPPAPALGPTAPGARTDADRLAELVSVDALLPASSGAPSSWHRMAAHHALSALYRIAHAVERSTEHAFILLDEAGRASSVTLGPTDLLGNVSELVKGTKPRPSAALLSAQHLASIADLLKTGRFLTVDNRPFFDELPTKSEPTEIDDDRAARAWLAQRGEPDSPPLESLSPGAQRVVVKLGLAAMSSTPSPNVDELDTDEPADEGPAVELRVTSTKATVGLAFTLVSAGAELVDPPTLTAGAGLDLQATLPTLSVRWPRLTKALADELVSELEAAGAEPEVITWPLLESKS